MRRSTTTLWGVMILALAATNAWGHGIDLFARVEGTAIKGTMAYADGTPVANRPVRAFAPDGSVIQETTTDEAGHFTMPVTSPVRHRLVGEAGEGHRGLFTVSEAEVKLAFGEAGPQGGGTATATEGPTATAAIDQAALEAAIARQLGPLRDQLHAHDQRVRLRDVLGGIGYVFGLAGLYVLWKQRAKGSSTGR